MHRDACTKGEATYCPEDNKLRLYCGRIPRDEYEELRSQGWKSTPKQDCDFVATWHPHREDTALAMIEDGDTIGDEDQDPEDRAADRAERFSGYRDRRRSEAHGHADTFEAGPSCHGYQNQGRADRAASRHDHQRVKAYSQWDKAEYWQQRTEGVISNALYGSSASVRRGRIVRLETELRRYTTEGGRWHAHINNRLAYERQMLAGQGGAATDVEMVPGGWFGKYQILKVNKSNATKQPVSVSVLAPSPWWRGEGPPPLTLQTLNIQRLGEDSYRPPTSEDLETLKATRAGLKVKTQAFNAGKPKLINPTDEDAERLQTHLNAKAIERVRGHSNYMPDLHKDPAPTPVLRLTQKQYSANSGGNYASCDTRHLLEDGTLLWSSNMWSKRDNIRKVCKLRIGPSVRTTTGTGVVTSHNSASAVIVITDKPQKPIPELDACLAHLGFHPTGQAVTA